MKVVKFGQTVRKIRINRREYSMVDRIQLDAMYEALSFYDFQSLTPYKEKSLIVATEENDYYMRYGDALFDPQNITKYRLNEEALVKFLINFIKEIDVKTCIIRKYEEKWVVGTKIPPILAKWFSDNYISKEIQAFEIDTREPAFIKLLSLAFRGNSMFQIIFLEKKIIVSPSDHMDIFFDADETDKLLPVIMQVLSKTKTMPIVLNLI